MPVPAVPPSLPSNLEPWRAWFESAPQWLTGLTGALLLLAGGRLYRLAVVAPGLLGGVALALMLPPDLGPIVISLAAVLLAAVGALICHFLERVAVHLVGAVAMAGLAQIGWPPLLHEPAPWWGLVLGGAIGLLFFPRIFKALLKVITALLGALVVTWSLDALDGPVTLLGIDLQPWMIVTALFVVGLIAQLVTGKKGKSGEKKE
ncbi:MAG: hypothetical protein ABIO70_04125 [Pseudomonadota bacterium]